MKKFYAKLVQGENFLRHPFLLIVRLYWGIQLIQTGFGKWTNLPKIASHFQELHLPVPFLMAGIVATIELLGGISLLIGFLSRFFSLLLVCVFIGAYTTAHTETLTELFTKPSLFITADPFLFFYASLIILCFGPGLFSLDYWLEKKYYGKAL